MNNQSSFHNQPEEFIKKIFSAAKRCTHLTVEDDIIYNQRGERVLWIENGDSLLIPYKDSKRKNTMWRILMRLKDIDALLGYQAVETPVKFSLGILYSGEDIIEKFRNKEFQGFESNLGSSGIRIYGVNELGEDIDLTNLLNYRLVFDKTDNHRDDLVYEFDEFGFELALAECKTIWFYEYSDQIEDKQISSTTTILSKRPDGKWSARFSV